MNLISSPLFGETREATDDERSRIASEVRDIPVAVFQELNKALNERGLMLSVTTTESSTPKLSD